MVIQESNSSKQVRLGPLITNPHTLVVWGFLILFSQHLKKKVVLNHTLNEELLKYKPKFDKTKSDKQSTGILLALLGAILFGGKVIKG